MLFRSLRPNLFLYGHTCPYGFHIPYPYGIFPYGYGVWIESLVQRSEADHMLTPNWVGVRGVTPNGVGVRTSNFGLRTPNRVGVRTVFISRPRL